MNRQETMRLESEIQLPTTMSEFRDAFEEMVGDSPDIVYRHIQFAGVPVVVVYIEGMADPRGVLDSLL
ncbi:MAG: hypothetical protein K0Q63_2255, partial [Paenibacillus sp.]|nr:hypothetical protein [Paenibacillus sp.]